MMHLGETAEQPQHGIPLQDLDMRNGGGGGKTKQKKTSKSAFLTRPSPGLMLVSWTSSKQVDWLIRGSDVVLTV